MILMESDMNRHDFSSVGDYLPALTAQALLETRGDRNLAEELAQHVLVQCIRGLYDPTRGPFAAWARVVMLHYRLDLLRASLRTIGHGDYVPELTDDFNSHNITEQHLDLTDPFGPEDLTIISNWSAKDRVILLCRGLLWRKVPEQLWKETLRILHLPEHFPGPDFVELNEKDRNAYLSEHLGIPANTLCQFWRRGRDRVRGLRCVRELATFE
jgi:hypothetical protein